MQDSIRLTANTAMVWLWCSGQLWDGYKDKLNEMEHGGEEPHPSPSLNVTGKTFETPTVSAQQIEQHVERVTVQEIDW